MQRKKRIKKQPSEQHEHEQRDARLAFRLPPSVADRWRAAARAAGVSLSDWLRAQIDESQRTGIAPPGRRTRRNYTPADPELLRQLAWIGNNINQLARRANATRAIDAVSILAELASLRSVLSSLLPSAAAQAAQQRSGEPDAH